MKFSLPTTLICMTASSIAAAQTSDIAARMERSQVYDEPDAQQMEAERQRLGIQRIQQEMEIRARDEEERRIEEERQRSLQSQEPAQQQLIEPQEEAPAIKDGITPTSQSSHARSNSDMTQALEQLRLLGELKDAGYISEQEHKELKQKILDDLN